MKQLSSVEKNWASVHELNMNEEWKITNEIEEMNEELDDE